MTGPGSGHCLAATPSSPAAGTLRAAHGMPTALVVLMSVVPLRGRYYAGLLVLLHSLVHHNTAEPDCGGLMVVWHPSFEETVLSEAQRAELKCIAGSRRIEFVRVDDSRAAVWRRVPTRCNCSEASSSLLKLETFYLERRNHAVLFLDSDMLVMQPLNRIAMSMSYRALHLPVYNSTNPATGTRKMWRLHGSAARGAAGTQPSAIQLGFHAFVQPVPTDFSAEMMQVCLSLIERNRIKDNLDQDVVKLALHSLGMRYEPKRFNRSKSWRNRPRQLFLHADWHVRRACSSPHDTHACLDHASSSASDQLLSVRQARHRHQEGAALGRPSQAVGVPGQATRADLLCHQRQRPLTGLLRPAARPLAGRMQSHRWQWLRRQLARARLHAKLRPRSWWAGNP